MNPGVLQITLPGLVLAFIPVAVVMVVLYRWSLGAGTATYALGRMLLQLVLIGYVLNFLFAADQGALVAGALAVMLMAASSIAVRPVQQRNAGNLWSRPGGHLCWRPAGTAGWLLSW